MKTDLAIGAYILSSAGSLAKKFLFGLIMISFMVLFIFITLEVSLRLLGKTPLQSLNHQEESVIVEEDSVFAWKNKPGVYTQWPNDWGNGGNIKMTIWPGGMRATSREKIERDRKVLMVGDSFMEGWALDDTETLAWRLQERFPDLEFLNYGTIGYGTYQSLMTVEEYLRTSQSPPDLIIYGFADFHSGRNVASPGWLRVVTASSSRGRASLPYCALGPDGSLVRCAPVSYPVNVFNRNSVVLDYLIRGYIYALSLKRIAGQEEVTRKLLLEMHDLSKKNGTKLVVAFLSAKDQARDSYSEFLEESGIDFVNCIPPENADFNLVVENEGHPSAEQNSYWADVISRYIRENLRAA